MRIKRGTLPADKQGGRLYVYLTDDPTGDPTPDRTDALIAELQFIDHANACRGRSYGGGSGAGVSGPTGPGPCGLPRNVIRRSSSAGFPLIGLLGSQRSPDLSFSGARLPPILEKCGVPLRTLATGSARRASARLGGSGADEPEVYGPHHSLGAVGDA
jgi:hypothetical protein